MPSRAILARTELAHDGAPTSPASSKWPIYGVRGIGRCGEMSIGSINGSEEQRGETSALLVDNVLRAMGGLARGYPMARLASFP